MHPAVEDKLKIGQKNVQEVRGKEALQAAYTAWNDSDLALFLSDIVEHGRQHGRTRRCPIRVGEGAWVCRSNPWGACSPIVGRRNSSLPWEWLAWRSGSQSTAAEDAEAGGKDGGVIDELFYVPSFEERVAHAKKSMRKRGPPWNDAWKCWKAWLALRLQIKLTCIFIRRIFLWWLFFQLRLRLTSPAHSKRSGGISWKQFPDRVASPWCLQNNFRYGFCLTCAPRPVHQHWSKKKLSLWVKFSALRTLPWKIWERRPDARSTLQPCTTPQAAKLSKQKGKASPSAAVLA